MNIKINLTNKQIELLGAVTFDETRKLVDALIAAYGWKAEDVTIRSALPEIVERVIVREHRPLWYDSWRPYQIFCSTGGSLLRPTISGDSMTTTNTVYGIATSGQVHNTSAIFSDQFGKDQS